MPCSERNYPWSPEIWISLPGWVTYTLNKLQNWTSPFTYNLCMYLKWASYMQNVVRSYCFYPIWESCLLFGIFKPFLFNMLIYYMFGLNSTILLVVSIWFWSLFLLSLGLIENFLWFHFIYAIIDKITIDIMYTFKKLSGYSWVYNIHL